MYLKEFGILGQLDVLAFILSTTLYVVNKTIESRTRLQWFAVWTFMFVATRLPLEPI